jgi:hypothetical protein
MKTAKELIFLGRITVTGLSLKMGISEKEVIKKIRSKNWTNCQKFILKNL